MNNEPVTSAARFARASLCSLLAVSLGLGGCASPYVHSVPPAASIPEAPPATLGQAIAHSRSLHEAYRAKTIELGEMERLSLNSLIVLFGAMVGVAGVGGHANTLRNAAVVGGTGLALGMVNSDQRRAMIYVAGMRALECTNDLVAPMNLHPGTLEALRRDIAAIGDGTKKTSRSKADLIAAALLVRDRVPGSADALASADQAIAEAEIALAEASVAHAAGEDLLAKHALAAENLQGAVHRIDTAVLDAVRGTEVSILLLPRIIGGLKDNIALFQGAATQQPKGEVLGVKTPGAESQEKAQGKTQQRTPGDAALLANLSVAVANASADAALLGATSQRLTRAVNAIKARVDANAAVKCAVQAPVMTLTPDALTFIQNTVDAQVVEVRDGKPSYREPPTIVPSGATGLTATFSLNDAKMAVLTVKSDANLAAGNYAIVVTDAAGDVRMLPVRATPPAAPAEDIKRYVALLSPLKVNDVEVKLGDVTAAAGGGIKVAYTPPAGKDAKPEDVEAALRKDAGLVNLLGKGRLVAERKS